MATSSAPEFPYPGGTPGDEPADPVAGKPGHFAWSRWIKQFVKNLDTSLMAHQDAADPHPQYVTTAELPAATVRVTHPNTDDTRVEVWDAGKSRWQTVHYDSGWRDMSAALATPANWTGVNAKWRRVDAFVEVVTTMSVAAGANVIGTRGTGVLWATADLSGFRTWGLQFLEYGHVHTAGGIFPAMVTGYGYNLEMHYGAFGGAPTLDVGSLVNVRMHYPVDSEAVPTSLPGTLVSAAPAVLEV